MKRLSFLLMKNKFKPMKENSAVFGMNKMSIWQKNNYLEISEAFCEDLLNADCTYMTQENTRKGANTVDTAV
jgi:hypothetical protein